MRAAVHDRYGPPEVVSVRELPDPKAGPNELLVAVRATTVNRTDCHYRAGSPPPMRLLSGLTRPKWSVWGCEFAGRVERTGDEVADFAVGDRVFGYLEGRFGAHAELLVVGADGLVAKVPDHVAYADAAPMTEGTHYAQSLLDLTTVMSGTDVLVYGASGAIGTAAVQLAKAAGATVTAVCGTDGVELVRSLGADRVLDYQTGDFTDDDHRHDVVLDAWGMLSFRRATRTMKARCDYLSTGPGPHLQNVVLPALTRFSSRRVRFRPPRFDRDTLGRFATMLGAGQLRAPIDRHFHLEEIVEAYRFVETGQKLGNVVIDVTTDATDTAGRTPSGSPG